jgi:site-specific DNA recombinase
MTIRSEQVSQEYLTQAQQIIVDIYCRVSGKNQEDNTSLDEQEAKGRQFAEDHGFKVGEVYREVGSGYTLNRKKLKLMQERYKDGIIQGVVIWKVSRLARTQEFINYLMVEMQVHSCQIFCVYTPLNDKDDDYQLRLFMETFFAARERKEIVEKLAEGKRNAINLKERYALSGGATPLYGYSRIITKGKKVGFKIEEELMNHVRRAFEMIGIHNCSIIQVQNELSFLTGKKWHRSNIRRILHDIRYTGKGAKAYFSPSKKHATFRIGEIDLPDGTYPKAIDDELFEAVQERLRKNALENPRSNARYENYLLAGFVRCKICGSKMVRKYQPSGRKGQKKEFYKCQTAQTDGTPPEHRHSISINAAHLDKEVWSFLEELARESELIGQAIDKYLSQDMMKASIKGIGLNIAEHERRFQSWHNDLAMGRVAEGMRSYVYQQMEIEQNNIQLLQDMLKNEGERKVELEKKVKALRKIQGWYEKIHASSEEGEELSFEEKRDFIETIDLRIYINLFDTDNRKAKRWELTVEAKEFEGLKELLSVGPPRPHLEPQHPDLHLPPQ